MANNEPIYSKQALVGAPRIDELDWLRGLMALAILVYHSVVFTDLSWTVDASSALGRLGIYGVSVFFVLSGLSMAHVYWAMKGWPAIGRFYVRRIFRICPLLALVVAVEGLRAWVSGTPYSLWTLLSNATGLFGFISPSNYINVGAWSIGNEMVFYALTPALIFASNKGFGNLVTLVTFAMSGYFAFVLLTPAQTLSAQWATYVNPINNLFFFVAGMAIYFNFHRVSLTRLWCVLLLCVPPVVFAIYPIAGNQITVVTGLGRVVFSLLAILVVFAFYKAAPTLPMVLRMTLDRLGIISYGVYLLHPYLISVVRRSPVDLAEISPWLFILAITVSTVIVSNIVYLIYERPFVSIGRHLTSRSQS